MTKLFWLAGGELSNVRAPRPRRRGAHARPRRRLGHAVALAAAVLAVPLWWAAYTGAHR